MSRDLLSVVITALLLSALGEACPAAVPIQSIPASLSASGIDFSGLSTGTFESLPPSPGLNLVPLGTETRIDLGLPEHWQFFAITNEGTFSHAVFALFLTPSLATALPGEPAATNQPSLCPTDPDLDLYVSLDAALTDLTPAAVESSWKSLSRSASETILLGEPQPGTYYLAVKSETLAPSAFNVAAVFSTSPFADSHSSGGWLLRGLPLPQPIPDAATTPGLAHVIAVAPEEAGAVHRVVALEDLQHGLVSQLRGTLSHNGLAIGIHGPGFATPEGELRWDDTNEEPGTPALRSFGPGSLTDFQGTEAGGLWVFHIADLTNSVTGSLEGFTLLLDTEAEFSSGQIHSLAPGAYSQHVIPVPLGATNLTVTATLLTEEAEVTIGLRRSGDPAPGQFATLQGLSATDSVTLDVYSDPPLNPAPYILTFTNPGSGSVEVQFNATTLQEQREVTLARFTSRPFTLLADAGLTRADLNVPVPGHVASAEVAARIQHPRVSDLALTLVSPQGTRVNLMDHRGGLTTNGLGTDITLTNILPISSSGGPAASTNVVDVGYAAGTVSIDYSFYGVPDEMRVYRGASRIFDSGMTSDSGTWILNYGPSDQTNLTVVMNEGDNYDTNTAWFYVITSTRQAIVPALFADHAPSAPPVKFAFTPFTNVTQNTTGTTYSNVVALIPEQSLDCLAGESLEGRWTLEVLDTLPGPSEANPVLVTWELHAALERSEPMPMPLSHGSARSITLTPSRGWQHFRIEAPPWARWTTNLLLSSTGPVDLWYSPTGMPGQPGSVLLASAVTQTAVVQGPSTTPSLIPGRVYYFSLQNTGTAPVTAQVRIDFDVVQIENPTTLTVTVPAGSARYFGHAVAEDMESLRLTLDELTGDLDLAAGPGLPLPSATESAYFSFEPALEPEQIAIDTSSSPVPLAPGQWHFAVLNPGSTAASGRLTLVVTPVPALLSAAFLPEGVELTWTGPAGATFEIQWSESIDPATWTAFPTRVTSTDRSFRFQDPELPSRTRYYRVVQLVD